jgi:hypothetical protein
MRLSFIVWTSGYFIKTIIPGENLRLAETIIRRVESLLEDSGDFKNRKKSRKAVLSCLKWIPKSAELSCLKLSSGKLRHHTVSADRIVDPTFQTCSRTQDSWYPHTWSKLQDVILNPPVVELDFHTRWIPYYGWDYYTVHIWINLGIFIIIKF